MAKFLDETGLAHLYEKIKGLIKWQNIAGIPSWISANKPTYTASDVGALPDTTSIPSKVSDLTNDSGYQTQAQVTALIETKTTGLFSYKGNVANKASLPSSGNKVGDVWNASDTGKNYAWSGTDWDDLGGSFAVEALTNGEIDAICA